MQPLKLLKRIKKPFLIGVYILSSLFLSFLTLHLTNGSAKQIFDDVLNHFYVLVVFMSAMSVAFFNNIDSITKDILAINVEPNKIETAVINLSLLKKEVIENAALIVILFFIELLIKGIQTYYKPFDNFEWIMLSIRLSIFLLATLAVYQQIRGFITATKFRDTLIPRRK